MDAKIVISVTHTFGDKRQIGFTRGIEFKNADPDVLKEIMEFIASKKNPPVEVESPGICQMCGGTLMWVDYGVLSHVEETNCDDPVIDKKEG